MSEPSVLQVFVFKAGQYVGSEVFTEEEIVIGSGADVDLALDDPTVAASHAILSHANEQATLLDLGASGGTMINRTSIQHSYVTPRDEIQIGEHTLKIKFMGGRKATTLSRPPKPTASSALADDLIDEEPTVVPHGLGSSAAIDDMISRELSAEPITASIEISGSAIVAARPVSGPHTPKQSKQTVLKTELDRPLQDAGPTGKIEVPLKPSYRDGPAPKIVAKVVPDTKPSGQPPIQAHPIDQRAIPTHAIQTPIFSTDGLDEDEIDELIRPGFSLMRKLLEGAPRPGSALEVISYSDDDVRAAELLANKGERFVLGKGKHGEAPDAGYRGLKIAQLTGEGAAEIQFPTAAAGWVESGGKRTQLDALKIPQNAVSKKGDVFRTTIAKGATATIQFGGTGWYFRFLEPPKKHLESVKLGVDGFIVKAVLSSFIVHLLVLVVVALTYEGVSFSDTPREEWSELHEDDLRDVEVKPPEPEPEPEVVPEPEPVVETPEPEPEPEPVKPPPPEKKPKKEKPQVAQPKGFTKEEVKTAGVLGALGKLDLKAPGKKSMVAAVSNIDAVRAPGGSNFRVGALVGKLPSSQVSVGAGGGGKLLTRGGAELLKGGTGFAQIGKQSGSKVRGKVDRVNSTRLVAKGSISREEVAAVINKHLAEVQYCYEKTLLKDPGLQGKLVLEWTINPNGSVGRVKQKTSTLKNPAVSSCIIAGLKRWSFPKPRGGLVIVSYPFIFSSVGF